jgi:dTMP kinase
VKEIIYPGLKYGKIIICDRYTDSTVAYQSYGRGLDLNIVMAINNVATQGVNPDLTILLDIPEEQGLARKVNRKFDCFEKENIAFHHKVRKGYLDLAAKDPERWLVIDAAQSKEKIARIIWKRVGQLLSGQGG